MSPTGESGADRTGQSFTDALDREGFSFQYAVLRHIDQLARRRADYSLAFEVSEFPVVTRSKDSRIDFILRVRDSSHSPDVLLICECKRSNPALSSWCFARAPYIRRDRLAARVTAEEVRSTGRRAEAFTVCYRPDKQPYHIGLPVNIGQKGDAGYGSGRDVIDHAAGQVLGGLNGIADFLNRNPHLLGESALFLLPVIFTTAKLFVTEIDVATAILDTGKLPEAAAVDLAPWLWFQYHVSSSLRHSLNRPLDPKLSLSSLGDILDQEHSRSIGIVSVDGIEAFIRAAANSSNLFRRIGS